MITLPTIISRTYTLYVLTETNRTPGKESDGQILSIRRIAANDPEVNLRECSVSGGGQRITDLPGQMWRAVASAHALAHFTAAGEELEGLEV
jgi:hypothetical protein